MEANDHDSTSEELLEVDGRWVDARLQKIKEFGQKRQQDIWGLLFAEVPRPSLNCQNTARRSRSPRRGRLSGSRGTGTYSADVRIVPGEGNGPNVCPFSSGGWPSRDDASLENRFTPGLRRTGLMSHGDDVWTGPFSLLG